MKFMNKKSEKIKKLVINLSLTKRKLLNVDVEYDTIKHHKTLGRVTIGLGDDVHIDFFTDVVTLFIIPNKGFGEKKVK